MISREKLDASLYAQKIELIPTTPGHERKKPIQGFDLSSHWTEKRTTTADLSYWRSQNYDRAAVLGRVSDNLVGLDFDTFQDSKRFLETKLYESLPKQTFTTHTFRGLRFLFKDPQCEFEKLKNSIDMRPQIAGEILLHHHIAHLPLNVHPSGFVYELVGTDRILVKPGCVEAFLKTLRERFKWTGHPYRTEFVSMATRRGRISKFDEKAIPTIVEQILPFWRVGYRHKIVFGLCGLLIRHKADENQAVAVINELCDRINEKSQDRRNAIAQVRVHFKHNSDPVKQPSVKYLTEVMKEVKQVV